ncbi:hypothetical protein PsorP6_012558 [Peronosclerospora sorghi]|uniref:Uncharacterized protein n=1 Tax=Peronosclerospora sorghi TaxID=230839 RepID=A0ACC0WHH1_9STRA|nr:hypothetical protein PsorP6_012558 [Peronosclerospora sorghi]
MSELKRSVQHVLDLIKVALQSGGSSSSSANSIRVALEVLSRLDVVELERRNPVCKKCGNPRKGHPKGRCATSASSVAQIATATEDNTLSEREEPEGASADAVGEEETTGGPYQGTSGDVGPERNLAEDVPKEFEFQDDYDNYDEYHPDHQGGYDREKIQRIINPYPRSDWPQSVVAPDKSRGRVRQTLKIYGIVNTTY